MSGHTSPHYTKGYQPQSGHHQPQHIQPGQQTNGAVPHAGPSHSQGVQPGYGQHSASAAEFTSPSHPSFSSSPSGSGFSPYTDPASLLRIIPLTNYAPTARVAGHLAPHTTAYPTPPPSAPHQLYPQYATALNSMEQPVASEEWALRHRAQERMGQMLMKAGPSYAGSSQVYSNPFDAVSHPSSQPLHPMPYSYMPSLFPVRNPHLPPTPTSTVGASSPPSTPSASAQEYFDRLVENALSRPEVDSSSFDADGASRSNRQDAQRMRRESSTPSINNTPTISRTMSKQLSRVAIGTESPDPLTLPGPSPSKKQKVPRYANGARQTSPTDWVRSSQSGETRKALAPATPSTSTSSSRPVYTPGKSRVMVEIPIPRSTISPAAAARMNIDDDDADSPDELWDEDDDRGDDGEWMAARAGRKAFRSPSPGQYGAMATSGRVGSIIKTGEKDLRTAYQKFASLLEDILEASDALPAEPTADDLTRSRFFDRLNRDSALPLLSTETVERVTRYVSRIHSSHRARPTNPAVQSWDEEQLKALFRHLERIMRDAEGVVPFPVDSKATAHDQDSQKAKSKKKGKKGKGSQSPEVETQESNGTATDGIDEETGQKGERALSAISAAATAAECCLAILDGEGLSKPLYSEGLLSLAVGLVRSQMADVIFSVVEGMAGQKMTSRYLIHVVQSEVIAKQSKSLKLSPFFRHTAMSSIAQAVAGALPHLSSLTSRPDLSFSDTLVIQTVYLAISPLFITEPPTRRREGKSGAGQAWGVMKCLRAEALGCLRGAFAKYSDQRQWIIEEILTSLVKLPDQKAQSEFQMANGTRMSTITALLLQLIQASALGTAARVRRLRKSAGDAEAERPAEGKEDLVTAEKRICAESTESCFRSASAVAGYLLQRCGQSKASKSTLDADFKTILDSFITDLLKSLYEPEWPAAALYLSVFGKMFIAALEDVSVTVESTTIKNIALDHLGTIGAKLKAVAVEGREGSGDIMSLDQIIASADVPTPDALIRAQSNIHAYLASASRDDSMFASARDLSLVSWATELHSAIDKTASVIPKLAAEKTDEATATKERLESLLPRLRDALKGAWEGDADVFGIDEPRQADTASQDNLAICRHRPLQTAFDSILRAILTGLDMSAVALRTKALKALSLIAAVDADILAQPAVRAAFESRMSDPSPAVRDAAVDLVGKYVVERPELAVEYYPQIALRVSDSGLAVRKKVIKLLKEIFPMTDANAIRVDICCKMVDLIGDADDNIKELAIKGLIELLFSSTHLVSAALLVDIVGQYRQQTGPIEKALAEIAAVDKATAIGRTTAIVDALVQRLVDAIELPDFDSVSHVRAISLLCSSKADLIDPQKAAVLLNYLRPPANSDEQQSNELLMRIFRLSIPAMPRTASSFAIELTNKLKPMIQKPSGGFPIMKETIGCYCAVVNHLTKDYKGLMNILRACLLGTQRSKSMLLKVPAADQYRHKLVPALGLTMYITALVAEFCNLDQAADEDEEVRADLEKIIQGPRLYIHLYDMYREFWELNIPQQASILSLGSLFRTYPDLVLMEETAEWMDAVFASNDQDNHARLLITMQDFLQSEARKKADHAGMSKDITALIGSTSELSDAGTSTSMVQRHFQHIINGAKSSHYPTQSAALDVLAFTVNQGLYHPLQCLPILVSLETSSDPYLADRALDLHATLHQKHATLVNVRYLDYVKASYEYQRSLTSEPSGHREGQALLSGWFAMLGEKRQYRLDFLKALGRVFNYDTAKTSEYDVGLALYIAENLICFEYRLQEEVMIAVQHLSTTVSTCTPLVQTLEKAGFEDTDDGELLAGREVQLSQSDEDSGDQVPAQPLINASLIVCIAVLAKNHLLACYGLSEDKCLKQNTAKKSALGDKPAVRRTAAVLDVGRVPLVRGVETVRDFKEQQANSLQLIQEDGGLEHHD